MIIKRMKQYGYDVARKDLLRKRQLPKNMLVQILLDMFFFDGVNVQSDTSNGIGQSHISSLKLIFG